MISDAELLARAKQQLTTLGHTITDQAVQIAELRAALAARDLRIGAAAMDRWAIAAEPSGETPPPGTDLVMKAIFDAAYLWLCRYTGVSSDFIDESGNIYKYAIRIARDARQAIRKTTITQTRSPGHPNDISRLSDEELERYADENAKHNSFDHAIGKQEAGDVTAMAQELIARRAGTMPNDPACGHVMCDTDCRPLTTTKGPDEK